MKNMLATEAAATVSRDELAQHSPVSAYFMKRVDASQQQNAALAAMEAIKNEFKLVDLPAEPISQI